MLIDVALVPGEARRWHRTVCIMVDVLRASSTIVTLLERGCQVVLPVGSVGAARRLAREKGYLLAGERDGLPPADFDFGNSPAELAQAELHGRVVVLTTSNGTAVLRRLSHAPAVLIGCFLNATACCQRAITLAERYDANVGIVCAGRQGYFVLDDGVCAGFLAERLADLLRASGIEDVWSDGALAARQLWRSFADIDTAFRQSASGRRVIEIGHEADLFLCAQTDVSQIVPVFVRSIPPRLERLA